MNMATRDNGQNTSDRTTSVSSNLILANDLSTCVTSSFVAYLIVPYRIDLEVYTIHLNGSSLVCKGLHSIWRARSAALNPRRDCIVDVFKF